MNSEVTFSTGVLPQNVMSAGESFSTHVNEEGRSERHIVQMSFSKAARGRWQHTHSLPSITVRMLLAQIEISLARCLMVFILASLELLSIFACRTVKINSLYG